MNGQSIRKGELVPQGTSPTLNRTNAAAEALKDLIDALENVPSTVRDEAYKEAIAELVQFWMGIDDVITQIVIIGRDDKGKPYIKKVFE